MNEVIVAVVSTGAVVGIGLGSLILTTYGRLPDRVSGIEGRQ